MFIEQSGDQAGATALQSPNDQANGGTPELQGGAPSEQPSNQDSQLNGTMPASNSSAEQTVEIDGEVVPLSQVREWREGHLRAGDYTRKTQELAEERRKLARSGVDKAAPPREILAALEQDPDAKQAVETLKKIGFLTSDEVDQRFKAYELKKADQKALNTIIKANPELEPYKKAIQAIGQTSNKAWEDIISDFGFKPKTTLERAKAARTIKGAPASKVIGKEKSISDLSPTEYAAWKQKHSVGQNKFRRVSK